MKVKGFICFIVFFISSLSIRSHAEIYGLVLSGGGGKGGYEVGVWKALTEYGIAQKVLVISGTSVGGLNAALFAVTPVSRIENIWLDEVPVELNRDGKAISQKGLKNIMSGLSLSKLNRKSSPYVYVTCSRSWKGTVGKIGDVVMQGLKSATKSVFDYSYRFCLNSEDSVDEIKQKLLATSAFPGLTSPVRLSDGYLYSDGGAKDNTPVEPVTWHDTDVIFVVHLSCWTPDLQEGKWQGRKIIDIVPSREMRWFGGMLDFTREWAEDNIKLGYSDTVKILKKMGLNPVSGWWFR